MAPARGDVGALDGVAEAPLAGTEELFAALEEERDRRGITRHYQSAECGYNNGVPRVTTTNV